jgi:hypothetical protein
MVSLRSKLPTPQTYPSRPRTCFQLFSVSSSYDLCLWRLILLLMALNDSKKIVKRNIEPTTALRTRQSTNTTHGSAVLDLQCAYYKNE